MVTTIFCGIISFFSLWTSVRVYKANKKFNSWPKATAKFIYKKVIDYTGPGADIGDIGSLVEYEYTVDGKLYTCKNIYIIGQVGRSGRNAAYRTKKFLETLNDGMILKYDPANPSKASLLPFPKWGFWIMLIMGSIGALITLIMLLNS